MKRAAFRAAVLGLALAAVPAIAHAQADPHAGHEPDARLKPSRSGSDARLKPSRSGSDARLTPSRSGSDARLAPSRSGESQNLPPFIPPVTDEDRQAAFPDLKAHPPHGEQIHWFALADQLEWRSGDEGGVSWDAHGWVGKDINRFWFRSEGETADGDVESASAHALYGRAIGRWWDVVAGVRQDLRPGDAQTWAAVGLQGLAPYWFEVEATAYVGPSGRTQFKFETEYELLLTQRAILQPVVELEIAGKADPERGLGRGLTHMDVGLRLRYEIRREIAPYVGVVWSRKFFGTADLAEAEGHDKGSARLALGLRLWM